MTIDYCAEIGPSAPRPPAKTGASRALRGFLWTGSAAALLLTLAAVALPALFALGGEGLDPQASQDLSRAASGFSLAKAPSALAPKSSRLQRPPARRVQTPPVPIEIEAKAEPEVKTDTGTDGRLARLIAPSSTLQVASAAGPRHWLERPVATTANHFARALPKPEEVAAETLEDEALAEAEVASREPEIAAESAEAPVEVAALVVPKPTFRPLAPRVEAVARDDDEEDEAEVVSPRLAPPARLAPAARQAQAPRIASAPKRGEAAPSPVMAYARPDAGALRLDPSAVDPPSLRPKIGAGTAIYDITAATVYLPNGERLEAHSGLGRMRDNPRFVHQKNRGPTPPHTYKLSLRESLFHGVQAIRLTPIGGEGRIFNRNGLLAHTYMLGARGDSNGCVSFRDYKRFLAAFRRGEIRQLVVVERMDSPKSRFAWLFGKS